MVKAMKTRAIKNWPKEGKGVNPKFIAPECSDGGEDWWAGWAITLSNSKTTT